MSKNAKTGTKTMTVRLDEGTYGEFMEVLDGLGLDFTSAVRAFVKQTVRERGLPFRLTLGTGDCECSESRQ